MNTHLTTWKSQTQSYIENWYADRLLFVQAAFSSSGLQATPDPTQTANDITNAGSPVYDAAANDYTTPQTAANTEWPLFTADYTAYVAQCAAEQASSFWTTQDNYNTAYNSAKTTAEGNLQSGRSAITGDPDYFKNSPIGDNYIDASTGFFNFCT